MQKRQSKLLLDEFPLLILPKLAVKVGLNEAIILQQVNYWIVQCGKERDGREWVFNTYPDWQKQFPFFSLSTIKRTILSLEKMGLLITSNYNRLKIDKTKWYTIDFDTLDALDTPLVQNESTDKTPLAQNGLSNDSICTIEETNMSRPLPETTSETTSKTSNSINRLTLASKHHISVDKFNGDIDEVIDRYFYYYKQVLEKEHPVLNNIKYNLVGNKINDLLHDGFYDERTEEEIQLSKNDLFTICRKHFERILRGSCTTDGNIIHFIDGANLLILIETFISKPSYEEIAESVNF